MTTTIRSFTILLVLFAFTANVNAQQRFNRADRPGFNQGQCAQMSGTQNAPQHTRLMAMLDLTEEQEEGINTIHLNGQKEMLEQRTTLQQKRAELRTLSVGNNYDAAKVSQLANEIGSLQAQMITKRATHQQQIKQLLNEEQRIKFDNFHVNQGQRMGNKRNGGWNQ